jgi:hypothetical protein
MTTAKQIFLFSVSLFFLSTASVFASNRTFVCSESKLENLRKLYFKAVTDSIDLDYAVSEASSIENNPSCSKVARATARVYKGSFLCLQARDAYWPPTKMAKVEEGLGLLDSEITKNQRMLEFRIHRLAITSHLPSFLGRSDEANRDKAWLEEYLDKNKNSDLAKDKIFKFGESLLKKIS